MLNIRVVRSPRAGAVEVRDLELPDDATAADALQAAGWAQGDQALSVWGKLADPAQPLRDRDRVELSRALVVDPMEARRRRQRQQQGTKKKRQA